MNNRIRFLQAVLLSLSTTIAAPVKSAIEVTFFAQSAYNAATATMDAALGITGYAIENFENSALIPGLSYTVSNPGSATFTSLPNVYQVATFEGTSNNQWDGTAVLLGNTANAFPAEGTRGNSVSFTYAPGAKSFGVGLSNFQSLSSPSDQFPVTDHELFVNGSDLGRVEALAGTLFSPGRTLRNAYIRIDATGTDAITSVGFTNLNALPNTDLLAFDHLAVMPVPEPVSAITMLAGLLVFLLTPRIRKAAVEAGAFAALR